LAAIRTSQAGQYKVFAASRSLLRTAATRGFTMPNPKRRHSKQRTAKRRSHDFLTPTGTSNCPNCGEKKMSHRACKKCGEYKGRAVLPAKDAV
jgi:large subunit ribosomal protein L32